MGSDTSLIAPQISPPGGNKHLCTPASSEPLPTDPFISVDWFPLDWGGEGFHHSKGSQQCGPLTYGGVGALKKPFLQIMAVTE